MSEYEERALNEVELGLLKEWEGIRDLITRTRQMVKDRAAEFGAPDAAHYERLERIEQQVEALMPDAVAVIKSNPEPR